MAAAAKLGCVVIRALLKIPEVACPHWTWRRAAALCLALQLPVGAAAVDYRGTPDDYLDLLPGLAPGDRLELAAGSYERGLPVHGVSGAPGRPIIIEGPAQGPAAILLGRRGRNTVSIENAAYVVIRNLEIDGRGAFVDGVKAEGHAKFAHHITLERLFIHGLARHQQSVGISTKCPAWDWVVRNNRIEGVGTGMYFGNSDGSAPFVGGLIEGNRILDTLGYNLQVKHQLSRPAIPDMPTEPRQTIIRRNVFVKAAGGSEGAAARPNVLVGHFPLEGVGRDDAYAVYGNIFFQNAHEALFQGEGNVALYNNLFFNSHRIEFPAIAIQPHNDIPRQVRVFFNTVVHPWKGIRVLRREDHWVDDQLISGNAVFAETPLQGGRQAGNFSADYEQAAVFLKAPVADLTRLDLHPRVGALRGGSIALDAFSELPDYDRDFTGARRHGLVRGAYEGN